MDPQSDVAERAPSRPLRADVARKGPVFVDLSGRRGRLVRHVGVVAGAACLGYSAVLGLGYAGGTPFAPQTLIPGRSVTTEAFGRQPKHTPEGRSGPSGSRERRDTNEYGEYDGYGYGEDAPTHRQHRRQRHSSGHPEPLAARQPIALPPVTTRPRPAPPQPDRPKAEAHHAAQRHSSAHPRPSHRESAAGHRSAGHRSTGHRTSGHTSSHPAAHPPAKRPVDASHTPAKKHPATAEPPAKGSGHPQAPGRTTKPGHGKSPQKPQSQKPPSHKPPRADTVTPPKGPKGPKGPAEDGTPAGGAGAPEAPEPADGES
ncbi:hypothetical protein HUF15_46175 [Streptomyces samsunensis]|uniref:hypothetical protein n=1 Tax=Streptomyces malaysiensis TaxID=92644 RepID=UPI0015827EC7|nr:hypothetical protein [Streptomyces samsunensis]NUH43977.1 hypothetical protein [Streptomyces samsunensis]